MNLEFAGTMPQSDDAVQGWRLEACQCHVWAASLRADATELRRLWNTLSPLELQRANQFRFEKDRAAYIQCRGILRALLARYLDARPDELAFSAGARGKPCLTGPPDHLDLRFNLSHSNGMALFAFARSREVGVDIEFLQRLIDWKAVAEQMFSSRENAELAALAPEDKLPGFFRGWTRKEAVLKATGEGIASGTNQIEVSLTPATPCRLLGFKGDAARCSQWSLLHLDPAPDFVGAVAVEWPNMQFRRGIWRAGIY